MKIVTNKNTITVKWPKPAKRLKVKKKLNRVKKTSIKKLKKELMELVKAYVKKRDNYTCQKCEKKIEGSNCQASHVFPVSSGNRLAFDPMNIKVLCCHCHLNWWHKNPTQSGVWFRRKFPERYKYLDERKHEIVKWKEIDYRIQIDNFKK